MYSDEHLDKENMENMTSGFGLEPDPESLRTTENDIVDNISETDRDLTHDSIDVQDTENKAVPDTENTTGEKNPGIHTPKTPKKSRKKKKAAKKRQQKEEQKKAAEKEKEEKEKKEKPVITPPEPEPEPIPEPEPEPLPEPGPEPTPEPEPGPEPEPEPGPIPEDKKAKVIAFLKKAAVAVGLISLLSGVSYGGYRKLLGVQDQRYLRYRKGLPFEIDSVYSEGSFSEDNTVKVTVKIKEDSFKEDLPLFCITERNYLPMDDSVVWSEAVNNICEFEVGPGQYYFHLKDSNGVVTTDEKSMSKLNMALAIRLVGEKAYLAVGAHQYGYSYELAVLGNEKQEVTWTADDPDVLLADEGGATGLSSGVSALRVTAGDVTDSVEMLVTNLITVPDPDTYSKPLLVGDVYSVEQEALLDEILADRVEQAGERTRGAVVAAARFLTLEFKHRIPYFYENGRLNPYGGGGAYADGEGRYYHKGLYLTSAKYAELDPRGIAYGPAHWGAPLMNWEDKRGYVRGTRMPNGLDCSSFVCWVLRNAGFDFGDVGAGMVNGAFELSDLGDRREITTSLLQSDLIKPGDLIYIDGHMAVIIGISPEKIYVAESLINCVRVTSFERKYEAVPHLLYTHISLMSNEYAENGNGEGEWTWMWEWYDGVQDITRPWNESWR